mmetsp:Transcript_58900/g.124939  ORF Transcript_58900/g.124939 Transcript_58900/m.124939 type:complete len:282 (+) Transcript_58900:116-961(+)
MGVLKSKKGAKKAASEQAKPEAEEEDDFSAMVLRLATMAGEAEDQGDVEDEAEKPTDSQGSAEPGTTSTPSSTPGSAPDAPPTKRKKGSTAESGEPVAKKAKKAKAKTAKASTDEDAVEKDEAPAAKETKKKTKKAKAKVKRKSKADGEDAPPRNPAEEDAIIFDPYSDEDSDALDRVLDSDNETAASAQQREKEEKERRNKGPRPEDGKVQVLNLPKDLDKSACRGIFAKFGEMQWFSVKRNKTGTNIYIEYKEIASAKRALSLNGLDYGGSKMIVQKPS